ncbi:MAG: M28 family peptidase [bacterium]|nr:M28 family peptidase [bacterium]
MKLSKKYSALVSSLFLLFIACNSASIDSDYGFSLIEKQCEFGARVPGTVPHEQCVSLIISEASKWADTVYTQKFRKTVSYSTDTIEFTNIIAELNPNQKNDVMLFSHYDSRPFSSQKNIPTPGANDGASSTGLLLALMKKMKADKFERRAVFVFFDGEDGGRELYYDEWFIGSKYYAQNYKGDLPKTAILLDMIGDKDLLIQKEGNSELANPDLNSAIFKNAAKLNKSSFKNSIGYFVDDDHVPLNKIGFRCVDIIDMNYPYWHTPEDTPDKCSKKSLCDVGEVILKTIYER